MIVEDLVDDAEQLTLEDLADQTERKVRLKYDSGVFGDDTWLEKIIDYCMETRLMIPPALDNADLLQRAILGWPAPCVASLTPGA